MKKDNYKTEFEEHRREILQDSDSLPSRAELHRKGRKPKRKSSHLMINIVLGLFTLIPVIILVYVVSDFYNPGSNPSAKDGDAVVSYEETDKKKPDDAQKDVDQDIALEDEDNKDEEKDKEVVTPETEPESETKPDEKPEKPVVVVNPTPEQEAEGKTEQESTVKTHKVADGETLYRISVKYYGSDVGVEKIKNANGLTSNNIMVGQTLTIP
ncbi:LysM peptidoglycan-binding domain-containing protein [Sporosarcina beigongshangi]|uniref:LysM peptidoglycan-binding domain-containing protein n=1 Tax=Sporosarcina beigongshangi TaxID=2782538 RepID=UPI00193A8D26|nr:LysM peptidoglycan-binding domain-containing protein [Sporosarcina beigongshangi]